MKINKKILKKIMIVIITALFIWCIYRFISFSYDIGFNYKGYFYSEYTPVKKFDLYKPQFEILIKGIRDFQNNDPGFSENYSYCRFSYDEHCLLFYKKYSSGRENFYFENYEKVSDFYKTFPDNFRFNIINFDEAYPDYIIFASDEIPTRQLIYTGGERPKKYVEALRQKHEFVYVKKVTYGWYDIYVRG